MEIGIGFSQHSDSLTAGKEAATIANEQVAKPGMALVFAGAKFNHDELYNGVRSVLPNIPITGCTSFFEITNVGVTEGSVGIAIIDPTPGFASESNGPCDGDGYATAEKVALKHNADLREKHEGFLRAVMLFCDMTWGCGDAYVQGVRKAFGGENVAFWGGSSCWDRFSVFTPQIHRRVGGTMGNEVQVDTTAGNLVCTSEGFKARALSSLGLAFPKGSGVHLGFGFAHGWTPLSSYKTITKAEGNVVHEVDGMPVFDFYSMVLGEDFVDRMKSTIGRYCILVEFEKGGCQCTDVRNPAVFDTENRTISFFPPDPIEGCRFRFAQSARIDLLTSSRKAAHDCLDALGGTQPRLILMSSCLARKDILHSKTQLEVEIIREVFGNEVPIIGFYAAGELGPIQSEYEEAVSRGCASELPLHHGTSLCLMAIGTEQHVPHRDVDKIIREKATFKEHDDAEEIARLRRLLGECEDFIDESARVLTNICVQNRAIGEDLAMASELLETRNEKLLDANERYENLQDILRRYTPHAIWRKAGHSVEKGLYEIENEEILLTLLFMDVKGFTSFAEKHTPDEVINAINRIFGPVTEIIYDRGGDIDKFIGDAILATFSRTDDAVTTAKRILEFMRDNEDDVKPFKVRIGVNRGRVVLGNVGANRRMDHTLIGDAVNLAQRLEANCEPGSVLISDAVFKESVAPFRKLQKREVTVKGKAEPIIAYECSI